MKKYILFLLLFSKSLLGMRDAKVSVFFLPESQKTSFEKLSTILSGARKKLSLAIYQLTDMRVANLLVDLKNSGIDVQIILDESSLKRGHEAFQTLMQNNIPVLVDLSETYKMGIMHNKFIIIDRTKVWTGSANLTYPVLSDQQKRQNDENILLVDSAGIASRYEKNFEELRDEIIGHHIDIIASNGKRPPEFDQMSEQAFKTFPSYRAIAQKMMSSYSQDRKANLLEYFPDLARAQKRKADPLARPISDYQLSFLSSKGIDAEGMSYDEAYKLIGRLKSGAAVIQEPVYEDEPIEEFEDSATQKQLALLRRLGVLNPGRISKQQASALIGRKMRERR